MNQEQAGSIFRLDKIVLKNLSLEMPEGQVAPEFSKEKEPSLQVELRNNSRPLSTENYFEVVLEMMVRVKSGDDVQILAEITQAGVFYIEEADVQTRQLLLNVLSPEMLYPYMSQTISDLLNKADAPKIFLPPFNFKAIYDQKKKSMQEQLETESNEAPQAT